MKLSLSAVGKEFSELARSHFFPRFFLSLRRAEIGSKHPRTLNPRHVHPAGKQGLPGQSVDKPAWRVHGVMLGQPGLDEWGFGVSGPGFHCGSRALKFRLQGHEGVDIPQVQPLPRWRILAPPWS